MLFFLEKDLKLALPSIFFKFLRDFIIESRIGSSSKKVKGKFTPNGCLILDILVKNDLMDDLIMIGLADELVKDSGKVLWGKNLKSMGLISKISNPEHFPSKEEICGVRIPL